MHFQKLKTFVLSDGSSTQIISRSSRLFSENDIKKHSLWKIKGLKLEIIKKGRVARFVKNYGKLI
jgi:hypothetical protein